MTKTAGKVAFAAVVGAVAMHAQQGKPGPGYVVAEVEITDPATFQKYAQQGTKENRIQRQRLPGLTPWLYVSV
jgi:hypothetical protein